MQKEGENALTAIAELKGGVCASIGNQVYWMVKNKDHTISKRLVSKSIVPFSADWRISCLLEDKGCVWIGSNRGLFRYYRDTRTLTRYRYSSHREGMLSQAYITDMKLTSDGRLIVSTLNGLNVYNPASDSFSFIRRQEALKESGLNSNTIVCLFTDGEDIWAGTQDGGVNLLYRPRRLEVSRLGDIPWQLAEGRAPQISAITEDKTGNLWVGTIEGGLYQLNPVTEAVQHYSFVPQNRSSILSNNVNGLLIDSDNHLWAYTWGAGISELDLNRPQAAFRQHSNGEVPGLEDEFIMSAAEDSINRGLWFGTTHGLVFYDKKQDLFRSVGFGSDVNEFESVGSLCVDRKGRLWVGTSEGLYIVDLFSFARSRRHFTYTHLRYKLDDAKSTQVERINVVFQDSQGNIWLGGKATGLYRLLSDEGGVFCSSIMVPRRGFMRTQSMDWLKMAKGIYGLPPKMDCVV